jgi:hypothetical protein
MDEEIDALRDYITAQGDLIIGEELESIPRSG